MFTYLLLLLLLLLLLASLAMFQTDFPPFRSFNMFPKQVNTRKCVVEIIYMALAENFAVVIEGLPIDQLFTFCSLNPSASGI